ncbi:hypothetical protein VQL36_14675 [Chengkuizengella sp. SCS-71B]|uniref:hypothetical protein n=1 Tax=Chengkuizengella sp. SCS-71B TaxID=3115290 RepID=UPI0032C23C65
MAVHPDQQHTHNVRGDAVMYGPGHFNHKGNIVKTLKYGKTTVYICDDSCAKTQEEEKKVLEDLRLATWAVINEKIEKGEKV